MGIFLFKDKAYDPEMILQSLCPYSLIVTVNFDTNRVQAIDFRETDGEVNIPAG